MTEIIGRQTRNLRFPAHHRIAVPSAVAGRSTSAAAPAIVRSNERVCHPIRRRSIRPHGPFASFCFRRPISGLWPSCVSVSFLFLLPSYFFIPWLLSAPPVPLHRCMVRPLSFLLPTIPVECKIARSLFNFASSAYLSLDSSLYP